jgi:hypothetical protein
MQEVPYLPAQLEEAIDAAYEAANLVDDGEPSAQELAKAISTEVLQHKVEKLTQRIARALHRDNLIATVFPELVGPRDYKRAPNPDLAKAVYEAIIRDVNGVTSPNAESLVQQLVAAEGYVLCRIPLSGGRANDGFYVTQNWKCIAEDFNPAFRRKAQLATERYGKQMDLLIKTVPALAQRAAREYESGMKVALDAGANIFAPALAAATNGSDNGNEPASDTETSGDADGE